MGSREEGSDADVTLEVGASIFGAWPARDLRGRLFAERVADGDRGCRIAHGRRVFQGVPTALDVRANILDAPRLHRTILACGRISARR
jgi:hypothetical protein